MAQDSKAEDQRATLQDPENSHEYYGIPVANPAIESNARIMSGSSGRGLPVFFFANSSCRPLLREYYDNVRFEVRGQATSTFLKKGFSVDFNRTQRFLWKASEPRVKEIDLMTNWGDKAKIRNEMAYGILREAGVPTHFAETIRLQQNGQFFSLTDMVEDGDDLLERADLNPKATLYKADQTTLSLDDIGRDDLVRVQAGDDPGL